MKKVIVQDLDKYIGIKVAKNFFIDGKLYLVEGQKITKERYDKLINIPILDPYASILLETPDSEGIKINEIISEETKQKAKKAIEEVFTSDENIEQLELAANTILNELMGNNQVIDSIDTLLSIEQSTASHILNVTILSIILGLKLNLSAEELETLSMGAILHDLGKIKIYKKYPYIADPSYRFTANDFEIIKSHPVKGFEMSQYIPNATPDVKKIILMHHVWEHPELSYNEKFDTYESYPYTVKGHKLRLDYKTELVSIVQACDIFEAMTNAERRYKNALSRLEAFENIRDMQKLKIGIGAKYLTEILPLFDVGQEILLSNNEKAIISNNSTNPFRPKIKYTTGINKGKEINLNEESLNITIIK